MTDHTQARLIERSRQFGIPVPMLAARLMKSARTCPDNTAVVLATTTYLSLVAIMRQDYSGHVAPRTILALHTDRCTLQHLKVDKIILA